MCGGSATASLTALGMAEGLLLALAPGGALATIVVSQHRLAARRRRVLNRAIHELRRPLQALALTERGQCLGQLELALDALEVLDREVNGGSEPPPRPADAAALAEQAIARWSEPARLAGRPLGLAWRAGPCVIRCEPAAISRALDNLLANALEHGTGPIRLEAVRRRGRVRLRIADAGPGRSPAAGEPRDPRRGHGVAVVASIAARHGGRFAAGGSSAVLELPLAR